MWTRRALIKAGGLTLFAAGVSGPRPFFWAALPWQLRFDPCRAPKGPGDRVPARGQWTGSWRFHPWRSSLAEASSSIGDVGLAPLCGDAALIDLGVDFGLHPGFSALERLWQEKRLAIVHAVGSPDPTRSHFDAQDYMETGTPGRKGTPSGWLNRSAVSWDTKRLRFAQLP